MNKLTEQARVIHSDAKGLCQQTEPDAIEYLDFQSSVLVTAYNISRFNGKTSCSLRLNYDSETIFRHYHFNPGDRKARQGLIYQLAQNLHKFPDFIQWDDIINPLSEYVIDFAEVTHTATLRNMTDIQPVKVDWLCYPYIPKGKVTNIVGDPGEGKSHLTLAVATPITLGKAILPGLPPVGPGNVLIASAEDGLNDTIRPRLDKLGADVKRIYAIDGLFTFDEAGTAKLEHFINEVQPILVIIDPLTAYMGEKLSSNQSSHVRLIMSRLADLADRYNTAIVTIRHLNKNSSTSKAIYRDSGSIDFSGAARSVLLVGTNPETEERAIVHIKSNLAPKGKSIGFELTDTFYWRGESEMTSNDILAPDNSKKQVDEAADFLLELLGTGPVKADDIITEAMKHEISQRTLKRAKSNLKVISYPEPVKGKRGAGVWYWKLPDGIKGANKNTG